MFEGYEIVQTRVGVLFSRLPLTPNSWTFISIVAALAGFYLFWQGAVAGGLLLFLVSGVFDIVGGGVARVRRGETPFGAWLDDVAGKFREVILLLGLLFVLPRQTLAISAVLVLAFATDFVKMHASYRKVIHEAEIKIAPGSLEKNERFAILLVGLALYLLYAFDIMIAVYAVLVISSVRLLQALFFVITGVEKEVKSIRKVHQ